MTMHAWYCSDETLDPCRNLFCYIAFCPKVALAFGWSAGFSIFSKVYCLTSLPSRVLLNHCVFPAAVTANTAVDCLSLWAWGLITQPISTKPKQENTNLA
jgi:hypothetical protein